MMVTALALSLAAGLEVSAPTGCVDPIEVEVALQEVGGLDPAEQVTVRVTPLLDEYTLGIDIALIETPTIHRQVPLRPSECRDIADLIAVLVQQHRRAALHARVLGATRTTTTPKAAPDEDDADRQTAPPPDAATPPTSPLLDDTLSPCTGPVRCGGFRASGSLGLAFGLGQRTAVDMGWDLGSASVIAQGSMIGTGVEPEDELRVDGAIGGAWRSLIVDQVEVSARGLVGLGLTSGGHRPVANSSAPCVADENGDPITPTPDEHVVAPTWFVAPGVAVRARYGYLFVEAGSFWHVRVDIAPVTWVAVGIAPVGR